MSDLLLQTKLFKPALRPSLINRRHLTDRLNSGLGQSAESFAARLTLVSAPAGFGKTTLISSWLAGLAAVKTAWLSLDENDNDPIRFLSYFIAALQTAEPALGETAVRLLQSPQPPNAETVLTLLLNDIAKYGRPLILILDDYHSITTPTIHQALAFLLDHQPDTLQLFLTTRSDPPLPLSRLRARGQVVEIRAGDLRFTTEEAGQFLKQVMGLELSAEALNALEERTEGWIAGLQLAALSMQGRDDLSSFIAAFTGSNRFILDYLTDEVLERRPKGTKDFLLKTAVLDRFCDDICDAITGQNGSRHILKSLERANLFITSLDEEGKWYRYHHLFAEVLRARLQQNQPDLIPAIHRRASLWFEKNGSFSEAVSHALAARDYHLASSLIEQSSRGLWQRGEVTTLQNWLAAIPPDIRRTRPKLCLAQAWGAIFAGQFAVVDSSVLETEAALISLTEEEARPLKAQVDAIQSMLASFRQDPVKAIELATKSSEYLPAEDHFLRGLLAYNLGRAYLSQGDLVSANRKLREAGTLSLNAGDLSTASFALVALGVELEAEGQLREAASCYQQIIQAIQKDGKPLPVTAAGGAYARMGGILYRWNQIDESIRYINQSIEISNQHSAVVFLAQLFLANAFKAVGNVSGAREALRRAELAVHSGSVQKTALRMVEAERARLWLSQNNIAEADQWAAMYERDLNIPDKGDWPGVRQFGSMFDYECLTLACVRMAQARWDEALSLLARLQPVIEAGNRKANLIELLALQAMALQKMTKSSESFEVLERAFSLAEPEGFIRVFIDQGESMAGLLHLVRRQGGHRDFVEKLLAAFSADEMKQLMSDVLPEPLSERELEVLQLMAAGATNKDIADRLFIAVSTVKKHIGHILVKLDAANRVEAAARARDLGLLP